MLKRSVLVVGLGLCVAGIPASSAWATMQNFKSYKQAYPDKDPKTVSCKTCHEAAMGNAKNLNAYGLALQQSKGAGNAKTLTADDYKAADQPASAAAPSSSTITPATTP